MTDQERQRVDAEIAKLIAETLKIKAEVFWYPFVVITGIFGAAFAVLKFIAG